MTAEELGSTLMDEVFSRFGTPTSIISDRGSLFTSTYWETFCYYLTVKRRLSTAFHPQTDGQTERINQVVECYLRCYMNEEQNDWAELLSSAAFAVNGSVNTMIGMAPFQVVYNYDPRGSAQLDLEGIPTHESREDLPMSVNARAQEKAERLQNARQTLRDAWAKAQVNIKKYYDNKHRDVQFSVGDWVLLSSRNIKLRRASQKLADKFLGPFQVVRRVGKNAYRL